MLTRQKLIVELIKRCGGTVPQEKLLALAFLLRQELGPEHASSFYEFLPYRNGPFSFALARELEKLAEAGAVLPVSDSVVRLAESGRDKAGNVPRGILKEFERFWATFKDHTTEDLVAAIQSRYPWYMSGREGAAGQNRSQCATMCAVYTAGYEGLQVDGFLDLLLRSGTTRIIDVRKNAFSRVYGFHGSTLARLAQEVGIEYVHMPQVGVPSAWRADLEEESRNQMFARYRDEILANEQDTLNQIAALVNSGPSVLMCMELDPGCCHRSVLASRIAGITGLDIVDLRWPAEPRA